MRKQITIKVPEFKDWKTTSAGLATAGLNAAADYFQNGGQFSWRGLAMSVGLALIGFFASDKTSSPAESNQPQQ